MREEFDTSEPPAAHNNVTHARPADAGNQRYSATPIGYQLQSSRNDPRFLVLTHSIV